MVTFRRSGILQNPTEGKDQAYKQKLRNVFSDENGGLPRDKDGNVDFQKAYDKRIAAQDRTDGHGQAIDCY
jgi:hypothetical protein